MSGKDEKSLEVPYKDYVIAVRIFEGLDGLFTLIAEVRRSGSTESLTTLVSAERFVSVDAAHQAGIIRGERWVDEEGGKMKMRTCSCTNTFRTGHRRSAFIFPD